MANGMSTINFGAVESEWVRRVRLAALTESKTLRKFCFDAIEAARVRVTVGSSEMEHAPVVYKARSQGVTDLSVGVGDTCDVPTRKPLELTTAAEIPIPDKLAALAKPRPKTGEKCPHDYMNWMQCSICRNA
jgi:hypothetical protein